jgi:putative ABC transport system permease protein
MPDWTKELEARLASLRLRPEREREIIEELAAHLEQRYAELRNQGVEEGTALALVREELLDEQTFAERMRSLRQASTPPSVTLGAPRRNPVADFWRDLRLATRMLRKQGWLTLMVVLTLALGIGSNGAIFALVDKVLLRDLPLPAPDRLMTIWERTEGTPRSPVAGPNLADWADRSESFEAMGGFNSGVFTMVWTTPDGAETVPRQWVTSGIFDALGVRPIVGRTFLTADDTERSNVLVMSESYWRARFGADPNVVGQSMRLDGQPFTVIGVVPGEAELLGRASIWAVRSIRDLPEQARGGYGWQTVARLKPGVSPEVGRDELVRIAADLAREYPTTNAGRSIVLESLRDVVLGSDLRRTSLLFFGIVGFVLLICFANIANLLLTRNASRGNELVIRSVLGADRKRLVRQFSTENIVLATVGGVVGLGVAWAVLRLAPSLIPQDLLPPGVALDFDWRIAAFCAVATLLVAVLFTLASASQVVELASVREGMSGTRTVTDRSSKTREVLVMGQVATAVALLYGAGLLTRTLIEVDTVDPGYGAESVLSVFVDPLGNLYPTQEAMFQFYRDIEEELEAQPGVASVAWTSALPLGSSIAGPLFFEIAGEPVAPAERPLAENEVVTADYFRTLDLPILAGRAFDERDRAGAPSTCIVNEAFAASHLRGDPIGKSVLRWQAEASTAPPFACEIVGVAANYKRRPDDIVDPPLVYTPLERITPDDIFMLVRPVSGDAAALISAARAAIAKIDREQLTSVTDIQTLETVAREATSRYRFRATLVVAFAGLALVLAMLGLFGVLAYTVQRRWREYGVRMALGAKPDDVIRHIVRGAARLVVPGVLIGAMLALVIGQLLGAMLFGVRPFDAATFTFVLIVLGVTTAASVAGPAFRATRIDPVGALRSE